ncbi:MAG TPA: SCO family protein [Pseudomonadales bacterium]|nr:SCO family protein [Pseudomonadales bacterium]
MMKTTLLSILFLCASVNFVAANSSLTDTQLLQIKFDQKLNSHVSPDLVFRDEAGQSVRFGDYLGKRPVVLILGYYQCPMLCSLVLNGAMDSFRDLKWSVGKQFDVVFVSIDPAEQPALAAEKKATYVRVYGRLGSENGWHFLTAATTTRPARDLMPEDQSVQTLADEIGFRFAYDTGLKQFAHPSGFAVLTPDGKVAHYFFGVTFSPDEVAAALHEASAKKIGSPVQEFVLLCCEYSPLRGKYGNLVMATVRVGGLVTLLALGMFFFRSLRPKPEALK